VTGGHKYRRAMAGYADQVWSTLRDPKTGLVHFDTGGTTQAIQQAAVAQIYAVLAWPAAKLPTLYRRLPGNSPRSAPNGTARPSRGERPARQASRTRPCGAGRLRSSQGRSAPGRGSVRS